MLRPDNRTLRQVLGSLLAHMSPDTDDKELLDLISLGQLLDVSYEINALPRDASSANFLVPQALHQSKLNQVWRYPPHMEFQFRVRSKGDNPRIRVRAGFGVPRFLVYKEHRLFGRARQTREVSRTIGVHTPADFTTIDLFGDRYDMRDGETNVVRRSVAAQFYQVEEEVSLRTLQSAPLRRELPVPANERLLKRYDANAEIMLSALREGEEILESSDDLDDSSPAVATIRLVNGEISAALDLEVGVEKEDEYLVTVRLVNLRDYRIRNLSQAREWRALCLLCPYLSLHLSDSEFAIDQRQYADARVLALSGDRQRNYQDQGYMQVNGVLTKSSQDGSTAIGTTFGVYDTLRDEPVLCDITIAEMTSSKEGLLECFPRPQLFREQDDLLEKVTTVLRAVASAFEIERLYKYQWAAICNRIEVLAQDTKGTTTVIKAPTGAGKTVVFMANAALHHLVTGERAALVFPTRILNEDMFKRLTRFVRELRRLRTDVTGGIYIGTADPLYHAVASPQLGALMIQFSICPECSGSGTVKAIEAEGRVIGECGACSHRIDYMFGAKEIGDFLPGIIIATPDKLFYDVTAAKWEHFNMRVVGGLYARCLCGRAVILQRGPQLDCRGCGRHFSNPRHPESSPITYFVFDEVHSLYGLTGTLLSLFLKTLRLVADKILLSTQAGGSIARKFTFETGTATISNERDLLAVITDTERQKIRVIPEDVDFDAFFELRRNKVRYRTLVFLPVAEAARTSVSRSLFKQYLRSHENEEERQRMLDRVRAIGGKEESYDFELGYVFRKRDGYNLARTVRDLARFHQSRSDVRARFLSGDSRSHEIARTFDMALRGEIQVLIANMVISLGVDIQNLNLLIMMGIPKSMTEHVQTAGRTGRGVVPGHVTIHLLPSYPRDQFVYDNFHTMMSDVSGYYDRLPIQPTNAFAAQLILPNVFKAILASMSYRNYVLTAPSFTRYFGRDARRRDLLRLDLLKVLIHESAPPSVRRQIAVLVNNALNRYFQRLPQFRGQGQYIAEILEREHELLLSLRARTGREIPVEAVEASLYEAIKRQASRSATGPWGPVDPEDLEGAEAEEG
jgi:hypothetical protein